MRSGDAMLGTLALMGSVLGASGALAVLLARLPDLLARRRAAADPLTATTAWSAALVAAAGWLVAASAGTVGGGAGAGAGAGADVGALVGG
ncbi:hypothetical protein, partial [Cellulomonas endophytica]|uniref:hypothetical protein n=1 Tax=Cellulomonas endophytica TaxID=2494735 RepID=UPI00196AE891